MNKAFSLPLSLVLIAALPAWAASNNEEVPANEAVAAGHIAHMIEHSIRSEAKSGAARRDAHVKAHGCVQAEFRVFDKLPKELQAGIFAKARTYPAWIRYSNGSGQVQDDSVGDGRGMAVKLIGVERSESGTQDFVMINHPVFFVRNAADYVEFQKALSKNSVFKFFFPGLNPFNFRVRELKIANAIRTTQVVSPLATRYWSTTPSLLGDTAMKFSARPCTAAALFAKTRSPDFLRENMQKHLARSEACFDFLVQLRKRPMEMPIEDPTLEWSETDSPFMPVARIAIPAQAFDSPTQLKLCENLSFTPWHTLPEHRPLGGINRVRKTVYDTISRVRHELNGEQRREPTGF